MPDFPRFQPPDLEQLGAALRIAGAAVLAVDREDRVTFLNDTALALTGRLRHDELLGRPLAECWQFLEGAPGRPDRRQPASPSRHALVDGGVHRLAPQTSLIVPAAVGGGGSSRREVPVAGSASPLHDDAGRRVGALLILHDLTGQQRADEGRGALARHTALSRLAGRVAHDFNNLLTVLLGNVSLAQRQVANAFAETSETVALRMRLAETERIGQRAVQLIGELLSFSNAADHTGVIAPSRQPVALAEVLHDCVARLQQQRGGTVYCELHGPLADGTLPSVEGNPDRLRRMFDALLANAAPAGAPGGQMIRIRGETVLLDGHSTLPLPPGRYVRLTIRDQGDGIPAAELPRIFEPYFSSRRGGARGLGLTLALHVAHSHGGFLSVEPPPAPTPDDPQPTGTAITLHLPAATGSEAEAPEVSPRVREEPEAPQPALPAVPALGRVLVMDDEATIRELTSQVLNRFGYAVESAEEGGAAVRLFHAARARGEPFDAVILDLAVRGGLDGKQTAERLLAIDPRVRLIVVSGQTSDAVANNYRDFGFCGQVRKPFTVAELLREVESVLRQERR